MAAEVEHHQLAPYQPNGYHCFLFACQKINLTEKWLQASESLSEPI